MAWSNAMSHEARFDDHELEVCKSAFIYRKKGLSQSKHWKELRVVPGSYGWGWASWGWAVFGVVPEASKDVNRGKPRDGDGSSSRAACHELEVYANTLDTHTNFAPQLKGRCPTSNANTTVADNKENAFSVPVGNRFAKFRTRKGRRVTAFGVLFSFTSNVKNTTVQKVADMVKETWFLDAIREEPDFLLARDDWPFVLEAIRAAHPTTPILILGGHSHIRDCVQMDGRSMALESGRFMETVGWLSMKLPRHKSGDMKFSRRYLDPNRVTYEAIPVALSVESKILPVMNGEGDLLRRSAEELDRREKELYASGNIVARFKRWLEAMDQRSGEERRAHGNLTLGYDATTDSCPGVGDDTPHAPMPFFSAPGFVGFNVPNATSDTLVDVVFLDFIQNTVLGALNSVQQDRNFSASDVQLYSNLTANQVLEVYAQLMWN
ncbi:hypothetical protein BDN71DRAFT_1590561 [Pleurotus eryngii]|uniref:Putative 5'-nucleotidase C-terminal domain-containing protein n=1 Tax=Pleurotus eryngii TaxID=5323 RepID=A0A9P5ZUP5_PLEER|nr:hypothetical protein BDN71DRAFT_1590561 [Pleurotus eryngii]